MGRTSSASPSLYGEMAMGAGLALFVFYPLLSVSYTKVSDSAFLDCGLQTIRIVVFISMTRTWLLNEHLKILDIVYTTEHQQYYIPY